MALAAQQALEGRAERSLPQESWVAELRDAEVSTCTNLEVSPKACQQVGRRFVSESGDLGR